MTTLYVKKINETTLKFACDDVGVHYELSDYFSFYAPGYKYDPRFKNHIWDGKIHLANATKQTAPVGLRQQIQKFCTDRNYHFIDQTEENLLEKGDDVSNFDQWLESLNLPFEPRDYQKKAVIESLTGQRRVLLSPTGCHAKGSKIVLADRSLKNVEDVEVGDRLLGYDNQPRTVLKLCRGQDTMYRVKSRDNLWNDFIVNKEHVLPLFDIANPNKLFEIEVDQYLKLDQKRKNHLKIISGTKDNQSYSCFDVEQLGQDDYYGFQLDGDHLYYNEDYVLQHNSGKSLIIYLILRWMLSKDRKCVVIVPSTSLVEQMVDDFKKYSVNDDSWDTEREVAKLYSKVQTDPFEVDALVTTWQSIVKYDASLYKTWDCVLVDECHLVKGNLLKKIAEGATNAKFKIGTTGSLTGENVHEFMLTGCFGPVCQVATTKQLQDNGQLSDMDIHMLILKYPKDESKKLFREIGKDFNTEIDYINKHAKRQLFTRNLACSLKGTVMILFKLREQGETLYKLIKEKVGDSRPVFHIDGRVKASVREEIRQSINDNKGAILVASVGTSATGLNIPCIENVILCPSKSRVRNLQSIGRGLRLNEDKTICNVFDLVDDLSYSNHKNYSLKHGMERYNLYQSEGFKVTFNEVKF